MPDHSSSHVETKNGVTRAKGLTHGRVERRKARTRSDLLAAGRKLFASKGVEPTSIAEIAEEADIAIGSFYNYFRTKDELLEELLKREMSEQVQLISKLQAQASDPAEIVSIAHRHLVRATDTHPDLAWLAVRLEVTHEIARSVLGNVALEQLRAGIDSGRFDVPNPELALTACGGSLFAVMHMRLLGRGRPNDDVEHAELVLRSFGVDSREAATIARRPMPDSGDEPDPSGPAG